VEQLHELLGHEERRVVLKPALRHSPTLQAGVSLIELMAGLAIIAFLLLLGVPEFANFLQNTQIRNAAETTLAGINFARAEAVRRNTVVRFQFVSDLTSACDISGAALNASNQGSWVVSLSDPEAACDQAPSDTAAPAILQKKDWREGSRNVLVTTSHPPVLFFSGLGRVSGTVLQRIDFSSNSGVCEHVPPNDGTMRCLAILVTSGGQAKLCDPAVGDNADPRHCS
jgi:type IV fimbrial biogenesis protein FimT